MSRDEIKQLMNQILTKQGKPHIQSEAEALRDVGFRSLDFSELALRAELEMGRELNFDAGALRRISTVADVLDFLEDVCGRA